MVWGACLEGVARLSGGCVEAVWIVWGGCFEGVGSLTGRGGGMVWRV